MNNIKQHIKIVQTYVRQHNVSPSIKQICEICNVTDSRAQAIMRRYLIYRYINKYNESHGYPPTRREISEILHISLSVTQYHVQQLVQAGLITDSAGRSRATMHLKKGA